MKQIGGGKLRWLDLLQINEVEDEEQDILYEFFIAKTNQKTAHH